MPEYVLPDLWEDTQSGHNIVKTVFMEWGLNITAQDPIISKRWRNRVCSSHGNG